ncbi:MAG: hypothetical protein A2Z14_04685 [Chloroflexi bacterium RBG_16_48_8]|nr:MAG: hypothetical protein A2Z14_04685 [Chloroflexi bacterium RBG_16_48_8]
MAGCVKFVLLPLLAMVFLSRRDAHRSHINRLLLLLEFFQRSWFNGEPPGGSKIRLLPPLYDCTGLGWYGFQSGDHLATISREAQQIQVISSTMNLLRSLEE